MENNQEKIIGKIKKVLELSRNNPSQEEAQAAALKAQALMAEYHISLEEIDTIDNVDNITEETVSCGTGNKWKYSLAGVIARNFCCKHFYYGKSVVVFYGHETDAKIAAMTFKNLFEVGKKESARYYNKLKYQFEKENPSEEFLWGVYQNKFSGTGIKNAYLVGFVDGIKEVLDKQSTALMIIIPEDVKESYAEKSKDFKKMQNSGLRISANDSGIKAREEGRIMGRNSIENRKLSCAI